MSDRFEEDGTKSTGLGTAGSTGWGSGEVGFKGRESGFFDRSDRFEDFLGEPLAGLRGGGETSLTCLRGGEEETGLICLLCSDKTRLTGLVAAGGGGDLLLL